MNDTISEDVKLTGGEIWEFLYGDMHGGVPEALTDDVLERLALHIRTHFLAATKPPLADVTPIGWTSQNNIDGLNDHDSFVIGSIVNRPSDEMNIPVFLASPPMPGRGEGFVLVPVWPTEAMIEAGLESLRESTGEQLLFINRDPHLAYRAMLVAASRPKEDTHAE